MPRALTWMFGVVFLGVFSLAAVAADKAAAHGLWVWRNPPVVEAPDGAEKLRNFCRSQNISEVYLSVSLKGGGFAEAKVARLIALLHRSQIRVEALLASEDADEPGRRREVLLAEVREILEFNRNRPADRFDGIHLDIEPQQRPENKGAGNLRFLPGLVNTYRAVRALAEPAQLTVNADIQNKLLKASRAERRMLLSSLPRLTLMLYELSGPNDGETVEQKKEKLQAVSRKFLDMAYADLPDPNLANMTIGLRTPDYGQLLPGMLDALDETNRANPRYAGWARHCYGDSQKAAK